MGRRGSGARSVHPVHRRGGRPRGARAARARAARHGASEPLDDGLELAVAARWRAQARLRVALPSERRVALELEADGDAAAAGVRVGPPLRGAVRRAGRAARNAVRPGGSHGAARSRPPLHRARLPAGAARRAEGSRRATARPVPWLLSSRGYGAWVQTEANGTRFDLSGERVSVSDAALRRAAAAGVPVRPTPAPPSARALRAHRVSGAAAGVGVRLLEEPRRLRAPGRRARGLRGLPSSTRSRSTRS